MEVMLTVIRGKVNRGEIAFCPPAVLGRSREADLTIAHPMVSRQHCELFEIDGLLMVRDLGSLNGTTVLNKRIVESPLRPDDCFSVGPLTFQVQYEYEGDLTAIPAPKLAEPEAEGPQPVVAPAGDPEEEAEEAGFPMFSEISPDSAAEPDDQDLPWADALPANEDDESAKPESDEQPAAPVPRVGVSSETLRGRDTVKPTAETSEQPADAAPADESDAAAEPGQGLATRTVALQRSDTEKAKPEKKKRSWSLWPFGGRKGSKAERKQKHAPVAEGSTELPVQEQPAEEEPAEKIEEAEAPPRPPQTHDTPQDELAAAFLADDEEAEDSQTPAEEPAPDAKPDADEQREPKEESEPEDEAFQDFLKGIQ